jgi:predicted Holliday junction resolvase-like endonuclease
VAQRIIIIIIIIIIFTFLTSFYFQIVKIMRKIAIKVMRPRKRLQSYSRGVKSGGLVGRSLHFYIPAKNNAAPCLSEILSLF